MVDNTINVKIIDKKRTIDFDCDLLLSVSVDLNENTCRAILKCNTEEATAFDYMGLCIIGLQECFTKATSMGLDPEALKASLVNQVLRLRTKGVSN